MKPQDFCVQLKAFWKWIDKKLGLMAFEIFFFFKFYVFINFSWNYHKKVYKALSEMIFYLKKSLNICFYKITSKFWITSWKLFN